jgi:hypothetical protein
MRTIVKASTYLALIAMLLTVAFPGPATAKEQVPFHGSIQGLETEEGQGTTVLIDGSGTGIATHLGRITLTWEGTVNLLDGSGIGTFHFIAANGDSIFTEDVGQAEPTGTPGVFHIVEVNTITGGTGRFAGATGSFVLERLVDVTTGFTSGSFNGVITSPGAAR